jgi:hypothetical protein
VDAAGPVVGLAHELLRDEVDVQDLDRHTRIPRPAHVLERVADLDKNASDAGVARGREAEVVGKRVPEGLVLEISEISNYTDERLNCYIKSPYRMKRLADLTEVLVLVCTAFVELKELWK